VGEKVAVAGLVAVHDHRAVASKARVAQAKLCRQAENRHSVGRYLVGSGLAINERGSGHRPSVPGSAVAGESVPKTSALFAQLDFVGAGSSDPTGNTGYTNHMAKVMVSLPDDLLRAVDIEAGRRGTTRSGYLRGLAEETLRRKSALRAERMAEIASVGGPVTGHGGAVAELVKANRPEP